MLTGFGATYAAIQATSFSGMSLFISARQCQATVCHVLQQRGFVVEECSYYTGLPAVQTCLLMSEYLLKNNTFLSVWTYKSLYFVFIYILYNVPTSLELGFVHHMFFPQCHCSVVGRKGPHARWNQRPLWNQQNMHRPSLSSCLILAQSGCGGYRCGLLCKNLVRIQFGIYSKHFGHL